MCFFDKALTINSLMTWASVVVRLECSRMPFGLPFFAGFAKMSSDCSGNGLIIRMVSGFGNWVFSQICFVRNFV